LGDIEMTTPSSGKPDPQVTHDDIVRDLSLLERTAPDEATRRHAAHMRGELMAPDVVAMAKELADQKKPTRWWNAPPVMRYHVYIVPVWGPICACIVCVFALIATTYGVITGGQSLGALRYAAMFGALAVGLYLVTRLRRFSVVADVDQISCIAIGQKYARLRTGSIPTNGVRDVRERIEDKVLEVYSHSGVALEIPMQVESYKSLLRLLRNFSSLYRR
jgi:hypothetical protein